MFYEKRVTSLRALMREVSTMDSDAGIRVIGRYGGRRCYCFITRFGSVFTAMIYARSPGKEAPGSLLSSLELKGAAQLKRFLQEIVDPDVLAFVY
jgi:hypothetical protein